MSSENSLQSNQPANDALVFYLDKITQLVNTPSKRNFNRDLVVAWTSYILACLDDQNRHIFLAFIHMAKFLQQPLAILSKIDLTGFKLQNLNLSYIDLSNTIIDNTTLENVDFSDANIDKLSAQYGVFHSVNFSRTGGSNFNFHGSQFYGSKFVLVFYEGLDDENISQQKLIGRQSSVVPRFRQCVFLKCQLSGGFKHTDFVETTFTNCSFSKFDPHWCEFDKSKFSDNLFDNSHIQHCSFNEATLKEVSFNGTIMIHCSFKESYLSQVSFDDTELINIDFSKTTLENCLFATSKKISKIYLKDTILDGTILPQKWQKVWQILNPEMQDVSDEVMLEKGAELLVKTLSTTTLEPDFDTFGDLSDANLQEANFSKQKIKDTKFDNSIMDRCNFRGASLKNCTFINCSLNETEFVDSILEDVDFSGTNIRHDDLEKCYKKDNVRLPV